MVRGPTKQQREAYALGQKNKEAVLRYGNDAWVPNPYRVGNPGFAYQAGETDRGIPQWDPLFGGPQPEWWDPNPIVEEGDPDGGR